MQNEETVWGINEFGGGIPINELGCQVFRYHPIQQKESIMAEYVYVLTNPAFPDFVKIGRTTRQISERVKELNRQTGVPSPFEVYCCFEFPKGRSKPVEKGIHKGLDNCREISNKEFFKINPDDAKSLLESYSDGKRIVLKDEDVITSPEEQKSLDRQRKVSERFSFPGLEIKKGAEITFDKDPKKIAVVAGDREVVYKGETGTLGAITKNILRRDYGYNWKTCRGTNYWSYQGENLTNRKMRMEEGRPAPKMS